MPGALTPYQKSMDGWKVTLENAMPKIADVLPDHIPAKRLHRIILSQFTPDSKLWECTPGSVIGAILESVQIGLEVSVGGQCWMIPFRSKGVRKAVLVIGYKGYKDLAYRTGKVGAFNCEAVYENDAFEYHRAFGKGNEPYIVHPMNEDKDRGRLRGAYCCVQMVTGQWVIKYLSRPEIEKRKQSGRANRSDSVWVTDEEAMWRKSAVRAVIPLIPQDYAFARASDLDEQATLGTQDLTVDAKSFDIGEAQLVAEQQGEGNE